LSIDDELERLEKERKLLAKKKKIRDLKRELGYLGRQENLERLEKERKLLAKKKKIRDLKRELGEDSILNKAWKWLKEVSE